MATQYGVAVSKAGAVSQDPNEIDTNVTADTGATAVPELSSGDGAGGDVASPNFGVAGVRAVIDDQAYTDDGDGTIGSVSAWFPGHGDLADGFRNEKKVAMAMGGFGHTGVKAQGTLTMDTQPTNGDTFTIGSKVYTFQTTLTDVDGNVAIGGSLAQAKLNLVAAVNLDAAGAGTQYAASMTRQTSVLIADFVGDDAVLTAVTPGAAGSTIATTETFTAGTNVFDAATLGATREGISNWAPDQSLEPVGISADVALVDQN